MAEDQLWCGGILWKSGSFLEFIEETMNGIGYKKLMKKTIVPLLKKNPHLIYQEDNVRVHKSKVVQEMWDENGIEVME